MQVFQSAVVEAKRYRHGGGDMMGQMMDLLIQSDSKFSEEDDTGDKK